ncbi:DUF2897 family protein [Colwellia sp. MEBiC06753]
MNITQIFISIIILGIIVGAVLLLKQSAKKFHLTDEQLKKVNERKKQLEAEEQKDD